MINLFCHVCTLCTGWFRCYFSKLRWLFPWFIFVPMVPASNALNRARLSNTKTLRQADKQTNKQMYVSTSNLAISIDHPTDSIIFTDFKYFGCLAFGMNLDAWNESNKRFVEFSSHIRSFLPSILSLNYLSCCFFTSSSFFVNFFFFVFVCWSLFFFVVRPTISIKKNYDFQTV